MRSQGLGQRFRNTHGFRNTHDVPDGFQNAEFHRWLDGPLRYREGGEHSRDGRPDRGRHTELTARPPIGWCGPSTRIADHLGADQVGQAGVRLPQALIREAGSRSQQPPCDDQAAEHDGP